MLCKIADLITEVPEAGDLVPRCKAYLYEGTECADVTIRTELFRKDAWKGLSGDSYVYCESGSHFYHELLLHSGLMLHASAVELDGKAYLFSAPSGTGKSTHTRLWQQMFGEKAKIFNDDKPALRLLDGVWYAYGTPWCGKDGININMKAPLAGICFLKRAQENAIRRLSAQEAVLLLIFQTMHRLKRRERMQLMLSHLDKLVRQIPVFELECTPDVGAVRLSYSTMFTAAEEKGL